MAHVAFVALYDEWCLGVRGLSSLLKNNGHKASILYFRDMGALNDTEGIDDPDGFHNPPGSVHSRDVHALLHRLKEIQPTLIGLTFMSNFHGLAVFLTQHIKRAFPQIPVIWGGSDATVNPDLGIQHADFLCQGEGEEAILELVATLDRRGNTESIPNIWVRTPTGYRENKPRPTEKDLDKLPFNDFEPKDKWYIHSGISEEGVYPVGSHLHTNYPTLTSRGCPFNCSFCCNSNYRELYGPKGYVRRHSVEYVIRELKYRKETFPNLNFIEFHDDVFTFQPTWLHEFAARYKEKIGLPFFAYTHPHTCNDSELRALREAGWAITTMGVQSGSEETLQMYDRKTARQRMIDSAHLLRNIGVHLVVDLIGNNPMESDKDMRDTFEMLLEFPADYTLHEVNPLAMYRNFEITRKAEQQHLIGTFLHGRNAALAEEKPAYRFWNAMWTLTQFSAISRDTLRKMADDPYLMEHPEIVEGLAEGFRKTTFFPGTYLRKEVRLHELEEERLALEGSRAFRLVNKVRKAKQYLVSHLGIPNGNTHQPASQAPAQATK